jgi:hypothetical protein
MYYDIELGEFLTAVVSIRIILRIILKIRKCGFTFGGLKPTDKIYNQLIFKTSKHRCSEPWATEKT